MPKKHLLLFTLLVVLLTLLTFSTTYATGSKGLTDMPDQPLIASQNEINTDINDFSAAFSAPEKIYIRETNKLDYIVTVNDIGGEGANVFIIEAAFDIKYLNYQGYTINLSSDLYYPIPTNITYDGIKGTLAFGLIFGKYGAYLTADSDTPLVTFHFTLKETVVPMETIINSLLTKVSAAISYEGFPTNINATLTKPDAPVAVLIHPLGYEGGELDAATISWLVYHHLYKTSASDEWNDIKKYDLNGNGMIDLADVVALWSLIDK